MAGTASGRAWGDLVASARLVLEERARAGSTLTYDELQQRLGVSLSGGGPDSLAALLRQVSTEAAQQGRAMLSALVVGPRTGRPGAGFFRLAATLGRDVIDRDRCWRAECTRLFEEYRAYGR